MQFSFQGGNEHQFEDLLLNKNSLMIFFLVIKFLKHQLLTIKVANFHFSQKFMYFLKILKIETSIDTFEEQ